MYRWIHGALNEMDQHPGLVEDRESLVSTRNSLDLFVTLTDIRGYRRSVPAKDPKMIRDLRHRHVLHFQYLPEQRDQFCSYFNHALSFAARATSSFPGAFPPININDIAKISDQEWPGKDSFEKDFFRSYELSQQLAADSDFVDGGVLDNFPFKLAIKAITDKPADLQVERKLIYIEPDPTPISLPYKRLMPRIT